MAGRVLGVQYLIGSNAERWSYTRLYSYEEFNEARLTDPMGDLDLQWFETQLFMWERYDGIR